MDVHEVCSVFPLMSDEEFAGLKADIAAHGQRDPVWTYQGKTVDGRNRLRACAELGIEPKVREWEGNGSLVAFVVSLNLHRRHLSSGQKAMCTDEAREHLAKEIAEQERHRKSTNERIHKSPPKFAHRDAGQEAAELFGTNKHYVHDSKAIREKAPDLAEKVKAGTITLPQAKREVQRQEKRANLEAKAKASPKSEAPSWEIVEADCVEHLKAMKPGTARLIFADPPYNIGVDYGDHHHDNQSDEEFVDWCQSWVDAAAKTLAPDGSMWVLIGDEYADFMGVMLRDAGLHRRAWIKWYESFGVNNANNFNRCSRHLFYCVKDPKRFVFNPDVVSRPSDRQLKYGDKRADPGGKLWNDVWGIPWDTEGSGAIPRLVGNDKERIPDFPTQLPLKLLLPIVGCASDPGDLIVDPFNGSGTTGEAAIRLGRRYLGIELSPEFARMARLRLQAVRGDINGKA